MGRDKEIIIKFKNGTAVPLVDDPGSSTEAGLSAYGAEKMMMIVNNTITGVGKDLQGKMADLSDSVLVDLSGMDSAHLLRDLTDNIVYARPDVASVTIKQFIFLPEHDGILTLQCSDGNYYTEWDEFTQKNGIRVPSSETFRNARSVRYNGNYYKMVGNQLLYLYGEVQTGKLSGNVSAIDISKSGNTYFIDATDVANSTFTIYLLNNRINFYPGFYGEKTTVYLRTSSAVTSLSFSVPSKAKLKWKNDLPTDLSIFANSILKFELVKVYGDKTTKDDEAVYTVSYERYPNS